MSSQDRYRIAPRLGVAALVCLGVAGTASFAPATAQNPPGNNGTVKVAPHGDIDAIPNNTPHVGCVFQLEWYGFDADVTSTVLFEEQAPTTGVGMTVSGDLSVDLDGDPGAGAGNGGFDGSSVYTLSFTGAPHPQQGYHVKLTINTPESNGADVKHKVFWVEGCGTPPPTTPPTTPPPTTPTTPPSTPPTTTATPPVTPPVTPPTTPPGQPETQPEQGQPGQAPEVLGEQAFGGNSPSQHNGAPANNQVLPTAVNAGLGTTAAEPVDDGTARVLLGTLLVLLGGVCARLGWRRARG